MYQTSMVDKINPFLQILSSDMKCATWMENFSISLQAGTVDTVFWFLDAEVFSLLDMKKLLYF